MDVYESPPYRSRLVGLGAALVVCALAGSTFAVLQLRARDGELAELRGRVQTLDGEVGRLRADSGALAGRVGSAERTLRRRERGIAPLAKRVLMSIFTVETARGYGSAFVGWTEGGATYLVTPATSSRTATIRAWWSHAGAARGASSRAIQRTISP